MNQAEELAAAEALNQLRARRKADGETASRDVSAASAQDAVAAAAAVAARSSSPDTTHTRAQVAAIGAGPEAGAGASTQAHLQPVLNSFPPRLDSASSAADASSSDAATAAAAAASAGAPVNRPWRNALLTATSMMLTKEARKKLRQLLAVLRLASEHLNSRVSALQSAMDTDACTDGVKPKISKQAIRHDIITTIKKCLAMISALATNSLPAVARDSVRNTILRLPSRWVSQMEAGMESKEDEGETESAILALATETLVSIRNITLIVSETLDRADNWVERLPRFKRGKRLRDEDVPTAEAHEPFVDGPTRSSSSSSLYTTLPLTRPSSPDVDDKLPSPKAIKVDEPEEQKLSQASTPGEHSDRSAVASQ